MCIGMPGWISFEHIRDGHPTSPGTTSGVIARLVAIVSAAGSMNLVTSTILGYTGDALDCWRVNLKYKFDFDDTLDVIGLHLIAAI